MNDNDIEMKRIVSEVKSIVFHGRVFTIKKLFSQTVIIEDKAQRDTVLSSGGVRRGLKIS